jgi:plasmid stabilization system protein ParE
LNGSLYDISAEAQDDLFEIWKRIASDSLTLADRIDSEFQDLFASSARMPGQGHARKDLTRRPSCFSPFIHSSSSVSLMQGRPSRDQSLRLAGAIRASLEDTLYLRPQTPHAGRPDSRGASSTSGGAGLNNL